MILRIILFYLVIRVVAALSLPQTEKRGHIVEYKYNAANDNNNETESEVNEENIGRYIHPSPRDHYNVDNEYNTNIDIDAAAEKKYLNKLGEEDIVYDIFNEEHQNKDLNNSKENLDILVNSIDEKENSSIKDIEDKKNIANSKNINKHDKEDIVTIKKQPLIKENKDEEIVVSEANSKIILSDKTHYNKDENDKKNIEIIVNRKPSDKSVKKLLNEVAKNNKTLVIEAKPKNSVVKKDKAHNILIKDQPPMDSTPLDYDALLEEIYKEVLERIEKDEQARSKNNTANDVFFGETIELHI